MLGELFFISSGLFLGWSLGANDAANFFGTAVGTRMVRFKTAATIMSIFVILGAVISGAGASETLGTLGAVDALPGAFIVAFAAALTVFWMTRLSLPVSTTQAIVGAIIGWNLFSGHQTDPGVLSKIVGTWVSGPILSALFSMLFFFLVRYILNHVRIHLLKLDFLNRMALILVGAFGAYSLGANNIANVMGVFTRSFSLQDIYLLGIRFTGTQQLFFIGGVAIAVGVWTYSKRVMMTVGKSIFKISPMAAFIVVLSASTVLFLFASEGLKHWLTVRGLPSFPLVPVSASQAVVGAVLGIGLAKGGRNINFRVLINIVAAWIMTPAISIVVSYVSLAIMQNVFMQTVF